MHHSAPHSKPHADGQVVQLTGTQKALAWTRDLAQVQGGVTA
ncbi:hypothetical protein [Roseobacter sp. GAI101]|nr:hypothetical protein [Roseobacter sp. GAI101]